MTTTDSNGHRLEHDLHCATCGEMYVCDDPECGDRDLCPDCARNWERGVRERGVLR